MDIDIIIGILIAIIVARKSILNFRRSIWPKESVAIFGPKEAGKTTLIRYLQGKPLPDHHYHTFGAEPVGKIVYDLTGNDTYYFRSKEMFDVGGEHINQWKVIIESQNPDGIIYIIDTNESEADLSGFEHIYNIYNEMRAHKLANEINLRVLLIILNKFDLWGTSTELREQKTSEYRDLFSDNINLFKNDFGDDFQILFGVTSLTHNEHMQLNNGILRNFAMSLANKEGNL